MISHKNKSTNFNENGHFAVLFYNLFNKYQWLEMNDRYCRAIITLMNAELSEKVTYVNCSFKPLPMLVSERLYWRYYYLSVVSDMVDCWGKIKIWEFYWKIPSFKCALKSIKYNLMTESAKYCWISCNMSELTCKNIRFFFNMHRYACE